MKTAEYLYGKSIKHMADMTYRDALEAKISLAKQNISVLQQKSYMQRDSTHVNDCLNAIKFNEQLLKELK